MASEQPQEPVQPSLQTEENQTLDIDEDVVHDDTDSAYASSIAGTDSHTLSSSILAYTYENGRRYHAFRDGEYMLPNDEAEQDRLDLLHHIFRMIAGGTLYRAPIAQDKPPQRILDVGTGTGLWAIELADEFPNAQVIGTDLSPIQPSWVPPNCLFYVDDAESQWTYEPHEAFDFIHGRSLCGCFADWPTFYRQAYRNLKPGGWMEMQEHACWVQADDETQEQAAWVTEWCSEMDFASRKFGKRLNVAHEHRAWMEQAGFADVREEVHKVPIGTWTKGKKLKEMGYIHREEMLDAVEPFTMALYTRVMSYSLDQTRIVIEGVKRDLKDPKLHLYVNYHFVWGRKPEHAPF